MTRPAHPGSIVFVDQTAGTERVESVAKVPDEIAFANVGGARVPVTRVVATTEGDRRVLRSFDAAGNLVSSTIQVQSKP